MNLRPADRVDRYEVETLLGRGGMAVVYRIRHAELGSVHALKVLSARSPALAERLVHEGRVQGKLRHPNIVAVTDVVRVGDAPALVVEFVDGPPLADWLGRVRPTVAQIDALARGILSGVDAAHRLGLVHRDLKPGNVLLQVTHTEVTPKVSDFGLAKVLDGEERGTRTRAGTAMGTPIYMPPEQRTDASEVDQRADVFSLGALLLELLLGLRDSPADLSGWMDAAREGHLPDLSWLEGECPPRWVEAVLRALAASPDQRPADAGALRELWIGGATALPDAWPAGAIATLRAMSPVSPEATTEPPRRLLQSQPSTIDPVTSETWAPVEVAATFAPGAAASVVAPPPAPVLADTAPPSPQPSTPPLAPTVAPPRRPWALYGVGAAALIGMALVGVVATREVPPPMASGWALQGGDIALIGPGEAPLQPGQGGWKVTWEGGRVARLDRVNFRGGPASWESDAFDVPLGLVLERDAEGELAAMVQLTETGRPIHRVEIGERDGETVLRHLSPEGDAATSPWAEALAPRLETHPRPLVEVHRRDAEGRVIERRWKGLTGQPMRGDDGSWGVSYAYDDQGRPVRRTSLGPDGRPMRDSNGVISVAYAYEDARWPSIPTRYALEGIGGLPSAFEGWHEVVVTLDDAGRAAAQAWLDVAGGPVGGWKACERVARTYTAESIVDACQSADGAPRVSAAGWVESRETYDARGYPIESAYFDAEGRPVWSDQGVHRATRKVDEVGRIVQLGPSYGVEGEVVVPASRLAAVQKFTLDDYGWPIEAVFYDAEGQPTPGRLGVVAMTERYTPRGAALELSGWDATGAPMATDEGWVRITFDVDTRGNVLKESRYDAVGALTDGHSGWATKTWLLDAAGAEVEVRIADAQGRPVAPASVGWARKVTRRNDLGLHTEVAWYDAADQLAVGPDGYAIYRAQYDARGLEVSQSFYGPDGKRMSVPFDGFSSSRMDFAYDAAGRTIAVTAWDEADQPLVDGCHRNLLGYDGYGRPTTWRCLGPDGQPQRSAGEASASEMVFDAQGRLVRTTWFGPDGALAPGPDGAAVMKHTLDARGNTVRTDFLDVDGAPVVARPGYAALESTFDGYGRIVGQAAYGAAGERILLGGAWSRYETDFDLRGRPVEDRYFGPDDQPLGGGRAAVVRYAYDAAGKATTTGWDAAGQPAPVP